MGGGQCFLWSETSALEGRMWLTEWAGRTGASGFHVILSVILDLAYFRR